MQAAIVFAEPVAIARVIVFQLKIAAAMLVRIVIRVGFKAVLGSVALVEDPVAGFCLRGGGDGGDGTNHHGGCNGGNGGFDEGHFYYLRLSLGGALVVDEPEIAGVLIC